MKFSKLLFCAMFGFLGAAGCGVSSFQNNPDLSDEGQTETQAVLFAQGSPFAEKVCAEAPSVRGRSFCKYMLSQNRVEMRKDVKVRMAELTANGVTDNTGSCTLTQSLGLSRSGAMPNYELRSFPKFVRSNGERFGVVPESTFKLRSAFAWQRFDNMFDFTLKGRLKGYPRSFRSRNKWILVQNKDDLKAGDLVMSKNLEHSYMFVSWNNCFLGMGSNCGKPWAKVMDNTGDSDKWGEDALVLKNLDETHYTFQEAWRAPN